MALRRDGHSTTARWTLAKLDRLSESNDALLTFLDTHGIVSINRQCKDNMKMNERTNGQVRFRCGKRIKPGGKSCSGEEGLLVNSFMARKNLPIIVILKFIYLWLSGMELQKIADEIGMASNSRVDWNRFCRQVVYWAVQKRACPIGGLDDVVEIDESKFGRRKYNRGHRIEGSWVFGGISRSTGEVFLAQVERRDRATVLPLIEKWIRPRTTIIADGWRAYDILDQLDYDLLRVNHSKTFKTKASDVPDNFPPHVRNAVHTNCIEATWGAIKRMVFRTPGNHNRTHLPGDLAKYLFIKKCRLKNVDPFLQMLMDCRDAYASGEKLDYTILEEDSQSESEDSQSESENNEQSYKRYHDVDKAIEDGFVSVRKDVVGNE